MIVKVVRPKPHPFLIERPRVGAHGLHQQQYHMTDNNDDDWERDLQPGDGDTHNEAEGGDLVDASQ